jgi:hypothetical protein
MAQNDIAKLVVGYYEIIGEDEYGFFATYESGKPDFVRMASGKSYYLGEFSEEIYIAGTLKELTDKLCDEGGFQHVLQSHLNFRINASKGSLQSMKSDHGEYKICRVSPLSDSQLVEIGEQFKAYVR